MRDKFAKYIDAVLFIIMVILLIGLVSCSANWHLKRAVKKDPSLLEPQTPQVTQIKSEVVSLGFNCDSVKRNGVTLIIPRKREDGKTDTVKVEFKPNPVDSSAIMALVKCPDPKVIKYPPQIVKLKPTFWEKAEYFGAGMLGLIFIVILIFIFRKFIPP
jgi:hypothetical protein